MYIYGQTINGNKVGDAVICHPQQKSLLPVFQCSEPKHEFNEVLDLK